MAIDFSGVKRALFGRAMVGFADLANPERANAQCIAAGDLEGPADLNFLKRGVSAPAAGSIKLTASKRGGPKSRVG